VERKPSPVGVVGTVRGEFAGIPVSLVVDLRLSGFELRDLYASSALADFLSEHVPLSTPKQKQQVARLCWELAEALLSTRSSGR
jgi:hypothetical protein